MEANEIPVNMNELTIAMERLRAENMGAGTGADTVPSAEQMRNQTDVPTIGPPSSTSNPGQNAAFSNGSGTGTSPAPIRHRQNEAIWWFLRPLEHIQSSRSTISCGKDTRIFRSRTY